MKPVVWLDEAKEDLKTIGHYIAKDNHLAAYRVVAQIKATADTLSHTQEIGRVGRIKGTREQIVCGLSYILPYQIVDTEIRILAVMHTTRKWPDSFH